MAAGTDGERRRHDRADVEGCALIHVPGPAGVGVHCKTINLSLGGILVRELEDAVRVEHGMSVLIELEIDGLGWARQAGTVVRTHGGDIAILFDRLDAALGAAIANEIAAAHEAEHNPHVVVVDPSPGRRRRITQELRDAGARSYEAATPLEAVDLIERSHVRVRGVAVARQTRTQTESDELVDYLSASHPDLHLAVIEDDAENLGTDAVRELLAPRTSSP
jgi:CheY-like chemotaxis protein